MLDIEKITLWRPKLQGENRPMITHNGVGQVVVSYYYVDDEFGKAGDINNNLYWLIIDYFCKPIGNGKD